MKFTGRHEHDIVAGLLTEMRESAGLSQSEMARRMGRGQSAIWKLEHGHQRVDVVELLDYARITGHDFMLVMRRFYEATSKGSERS